LIGPGRFADVRGPWMTDGVLHFRRRRQCWALLRWSRWQRGHCRAEWKCFVVCV